WRYLWDDPSEASVANYLRSGVHGLVVAIAGWGCHLYFSSRASRWLRRWPLLTEGGARGRDGGHGRGGHRRAADGALRPGARGDMAGGQLPRNLRPAPPPVGRLQRGLRVDATDRRPRAARRHPGPLSPSDPGSTAADFPRPGRL